MRDAQEKVEFKLYSVHTEKLAAAMEKATDARNVVSMSAMIAELQAESRSQMPLAIQSSSAGSSTDQPLVPLQGSADVVQ